jgi:hypothetical protein
MRGGKSMTELAHRPWNAWRIARWTVAGTLLAIPALAMQVSDEVNWTVSDFDEVNWTVSDFVFAGVMIIGTGLLYEGVTKLSDSLAYRAGAVVALAAAFLLIWINLAVGIIGNEDDPHNAAYFCEVLLAAATAFTARLRPAGMTRAMLATAGFQLLVTALAANDGWGASEPPGATGVLVLNLGFAALWLASAGLFRKAASVQAE